MSQIPNFIFLKKGEKGSRGDNGSSGKDGAQGQKGQPGPRGMPGICDAKVFASRYLGVSWCGYCSVSFQSSVHHFVIAPVSKARKLPYFLLYILPLISYIFQVTRTPPEGIFPLSNL